MNPTRQYFVTGGAGFIGSTCVDRLIKEHSVTVYDNLCSGKLLYIEHHFSNRNFRFVQGDTLDLEKMREAMAGHDIVIHFAANPDISKAMVEPDLDLRQSVIATFNVLESMRLNRVKRIIYPSGSGVYGDAGDIETAENYGPLLPISMYGACKLGAEAIISAMCNMFGMQAWIFRLANVVGKRQTHGVAFDFIKRLKNTPNELRILGDGKQSKSYIHVDDVLDAIFFVYEKTNDTVNIFNVSGEDYLTVAEIAEEVIKAMKLSNVNIQYAGGDRGWKGDVPKVRFNIGKIHNLGWYAKYESKHAMNKSIHEMLGLY